jgi:hypothetical protein
MVMRYAHTNVSTHAGSIAAPLGKDGMIPRLGWRHSAVPLTHRDDRHTPAVLSLRKRRSVLSG